MTNCTQDIRTTVENSPDITEFQRKVYLALLEVPAGETITYKELAQRIGCRSAQAVGQALRRNPFAPDVPCHRVIAANGKIGGYHGHTDGEMIERKRFLLQQEQIQLPMTQTLTSFSPADLADLDALMLELSATSSCDEKQLEKVLQDENSHVFVIRDEGHIVATATLCVMHTLEFTIGGIESVVVSSSCRGKGYGKELMTAIIAAAKDLGIHHLHLTSNPRRVAANLLYQRLGFEPYATNCYKLHL